MSRPRFYLQPSDWTEGRLTLGEDESRHCIEVLRCREGEPAVVFDGEGTEASCRIAEVDRREVRLEVVQRVTTPRPPAELTLCQAVPKGKNMDLIVQKATELGVSRIVPLVSERTVVRLEGDDLGKKREKWSRVALEACKQCGQNWLPEVEPPVAALEFLNRGAGADAGEIRLIAALDENSRPLRDLLTEHRELQGGADPASATVLIGPEGDFTPAELSAALNAGYRPLSLGPIVLRSETAAIYSLSVLGYELMGEGGAIAAGVAAR